MNSYDIAAYWIEFKLFKIGFKIAKGACFTIETSD